MDDRGDETSAAARLAEAEKALRVAGRELKWWQTRLEHTTEALQRARRQRSRMREQLDAMSDTLAAALSERYWATRQQSSGVGRLLGRSGSSDPEADLVREVEGSGLFDGGWYLRTYPKVVRSGTAPAVHYVRQGHRLGHDPGPRFSTRGHLERHPDAADSGLPALVHAERHGTTDQSAGTGGVSPGDGVHL